MKVTRGDTIAHDPEFDRPIAPGDYHAKVHYAKDKDGEISVGFSILGNASQTPDGAVLVTHYVKPGKPLNQVLETWFPDVLKRLKEKTLEDFDLTPEDLKSRECVVRITHWESRTGERAQVDSIRSLFAKGRDGKQLPPPCNAAVMLGEEAPGGDAADDAGEPDESPVDDDAPSVPTDDRDPFGGDDQTNAADGGTGDVEDDSPFA